MLGLLDWEFETLLPGYAEGSNREGVGEQCLSKETESMNKPKRYARDPELLL